jgi:WD40 repeat protein/serine/threonine protein kinase
MSGEADRPIGSSAETIFTAALELSSTARLAYLSHACGQDEQLRQRVEALLRAHDAPAGFLPEQPGVPTTPDANPATLVAASLTERPGDTIGPYKLRQKIGEGGCGVVYMAEQERPVRRKVALKIIKLGMDTKQVVARFEAERQALALMDHANIAKVLDAGATETGRPYFVMELVGGIKITDYCDQNHLTTQQRLDLFIQVCRAIQHAHQKGVIHRDIKPSNVLVATQDGVPVPKVIDFGIAKATQGRLTDQTVFTAFEQFLGTPAYMSPEQAQLGSLDVDTRSDIYSLGVLLYELLTGKTPFDSKELLAAGLDAMRRTIQEKEPPTPSTRLKLELVAADVRRLKSPAPETASNDDAIGAFSRRLLQSKELIKVLKGDLDWIVMKCLEKDRARRYETANGLATDIERHLNNEPVVARPPGAAYRAQKFIRRNKLVFTSAAAIAAALVLATGISTWQAIRATGAKHEALQSKQNEIKERLRAEGSARALHESLYAADIQLVHQAYTAGDLGLARSLLLAHVPAPGQPDLRGFEWHYFSARCEGDQLHTFGGFSNGVKAVAISRDAKWLAAGAFDHGIRIWNLASRTLEMSFDAGGAIEDVGFSSDGQWLAYCGSQGSLTFRELKTGHTFALIESGVSRMTLASRGTLVAFARGTVLGGGVIVPSTNNPAVEVWDYESRRAIFTAPEASYSLSFSPDAQMLAIVGTNHLVRVWNIADRTVKNFGPVSIRSRVSFSPDGHRLASGDDSGELRVWELGGNDQPVGQIHAHESTIWDICYSTNLLVTAGTDQSVRIWDAAALTNRAVLRGHGSEVWRLAISSDAGVVASGGKDGSVRIWSLQPPRAALVPTREIIFWNWPVFSENGALLAVGEYPGVNVRRIDDGTVVQTVPHVQRPLSFTSGDHQLLTLGAAGQLQFWNWAAEPRQPVATISTHLTEVRAHAFSPLTQLLALGDSDGNISVWDVGQRLELRSWKAHKGQVTSLAIAPNGLQLASGSVGNEGHLKLWRLPTGALKTELVGHTLGVFGVAFSADGQLLASASVDDTCRLWNPTSGKEITALVGHKGGAFSVTFSEDGRTLLVGTGDSRVKLWNLATFRDMGTIGVEPSSVFFSGLVKSRPILATVSFDGAKKSCSLCLLGAAPASSAAMDARSLHK